MENVKRRCHKLDPSIPIYFSKNGNNLINLLKSKSVKNNLKIRLYKIIFFNIIWHFTFPQIQRIILGFVTKIKFLSIHQFFFLQK
jgi:hypothetical protein